MRAASLFCVVLSLTGLAGMAGASVTLDFEGVPTTYYHAYGNQNLGSYYASQPNGPVFGEHATILDAVIGGYNSGLYPPHSGNAVLYTDSIGYVIRVDFTTGAVSSVGLWYTANYSPLHLEAYDSSGDLVGSTQGSTEYYTNAWMGIELGSNVIDHVLIHDNSNYFVIDDFTYSSVVPEPATCLIWSVFGGVGAVIGWRRRRRAA